MTMQLIETKTLLSAAASIEFTSIPQSFTDLVLKVNLRSQRASSEDSANLIFNSNSSNYSARWLRKDDVNGVSSGTISNTLALLYQNTANLTANTFSTAEVYIPNYTANQNKSYSVETMQENNGGAWGAILAGLWSNTSAITSITISVNVGPNFVAGSTVSLYGITKGSDGITTVS
jgi:hypothetical protein